MNILKLLSVAFVASIVMSCGSDASPDTPDTPDTPAADSGSAYLLDEGYFLTYMFDSVASSITTIDFSTQSTVSNAFLKANSTKLGYCVSDMVAYGDKLYIPVPFYKVLRVVDRKTLKVVKNIPTYPYAVAAGNGFVYFSTDDGLIARLDTASLEVDRTYRNLSNVSSIVFCDNSLYIARYGSRQSKTCSVSRLDLSTNTIEWTQTLEASIIYLHTDGTAAYVQTSDLTGGVMPVYKASADGTMTLLCNAVSIEIANRTLYSYDDSSGRKLFFKMSLDTGEQTELPIYNVIEAAAFYVNPNNGDIFVADNTTKGYQKPMTLRQYNSSGKMLATYKIGFSPAVMVFNDN